MSDEAHNLSASHIPNTSTICHMHLSYSIEFVSWLICSCGMFLENGFDSRAYMILGGKFIDYRNWRNFTQKEFKLLGKRLRPATNSDSFQWKKIISALIKCGGRLSKSGLKYLFYYIRYSNECFPLFFPFSYFHAGRYIIINDWGPYSQLSRENVLLKLIHTIALCTVTTS